MEIQDETPLPVRPLDTLDEDYGHAVLHLAWDRNDATGERTLLFAFVELIPHEIPPPIDDYDPKSDRSSLRLGGDSKHWVYVRHAVVTARRALDWYLACRRGIAILPNNDGSLPEPEDPKAKRLALADLGEEPPWPTLISSPDDDSDDTLPFCPPWARPPRVHHLLPLADFGLERLWSADERAKAQPWLEGRLHFDLGDFPEYWGSVHLIAPNPVYREMVVQLGAHAQSSDSVLVHFRLRAGKSVEGLELILREREPWGASTFRRMAVRSPLVQVNFDREVHGMNDDVFHPRHGLLHTTEGSRPFLRAISVRTAYARQVTVQGSQGPYEVQRRGPPRSSHRAPVEHKAAAARARLLQAQYDRKRKKTAKAQGQRWFRGGREDALVMLRDLLNGARDEVLLIDPYWGPEEMHDFALAVGQEGLPVRILSSAEVLRKRSDEAGAERGNGQPATAASGGAGPSNDGAGVAEKGERLYEVLQEIRKQKGMNPFEVRVMPGARAAIHDRFLVIDRRIWLLGSSLNEFGTRGSMVIALPDPHAVRGELNAIWNEAVPFEQWLEDRRSLRKGTAEAT
jgi:hypothetical protein